MKKFMLVLLLVLCCSSVLGVSWYKNLKGDGSYIDVISNVITQNESELNSTIETTEKNWTYNTNYPSPCPGVSASQTYITALNDSVTCTGIYDKWVNSSGDTMTGNLTVNANVKSYAYLEGLATKTSSYTMTINDSYVVADAESSDVTITLPELESGKMVGVKSYNNSVNDVFVKGNPLSAFGSIEMLKVTNTGATPYVDMAYNTNMNVGNITVSLWVYPLTEEPFSFILSKSGTNRAQLNINNRRCDSHNPSVQVKSANFLTVLPENTWSHVVCTYNNITNNLSSYVNGVLQNTVNIVGGLELTTAGQSFKLMRGNSASHLHWNGSVDDMIIWDRELSISEINDTYNNGVSGLTSNVTDWTSRWSFDIDLSDVNGTNNASIVSDPLDEINLDTFYKILGDVPRDNIEGSDNHTMDVNESLLLINDGVKWYKKAQFRTQPYAQVCYHNHSGEVLNFAVDGTYYNLTFTNSSDTLLNGFTTDGISKVTALVAGLYSVSYFAIGSGQNNHVYLATVAVNNVQLLCTESEKKMAAGGDVVTMTGTGLIRLSVGDIIQVQIADDGGTGAGVYYGMNLNLVRVGD